MRGTGGVQRKGASVGNAKDERERRREAKQIMSFTTLGTEAPAKGTVRCGWWPLFKKQDMSLPLP